jgi:flagellar secretion chaperone FliS
MTSQPKQVWATGQYRMIQHESRAEGADPVELVAMLYDELETALGVLIALLAGGQPVSATEPAHRARAILIALDAGLDRARGGTLAISLSQIYGSMRRKLEPALAEGQSLSGAWRAIRVPQG